MRVTALVENTSVCEDCVAEHGLSLLVEASGMTVLFDSGQSGAVVKNAKALGVDLGRVDAAVLSHGHYDHAGGFASFMQANDHAPVYAHRGCERAHWHGEKYIGISDELKYSPRLRLVDGRLDLGCGFSLVSFADEAPRHAIDSDGLEETGPNGRTLEQFTHEQCLVVDENDAHVLISGCSHRGIANIMEWTRDMGITHVIGGFHFMRTAPDDPRIASTARELLSHPVAYYTCHCTGLEQYARLKELMGERLTYLAAGETIEL